MSTMTKSAVRLAREALAVGRAALPPYSCPQSRRDYTQPQLFALLALKQFLRTDYRGLVTLVAEWGELRRALGLRRVPHYSTLCYAEHRLLAAAEKGGPSAAPSRPSSPAPSAPASSAAPGTPPRWPPSTPPGSTRGTRARTTATPSRRASRLTTAGATAASRPRGRTRAPAIRA